MNNIIIDFLSDKEHEPGTSFSEAKELTSYFKSDILRKQTECEIFALLKQINTDAEPLILSFLAHGGETALVLVETNFISILNYEILIRFLNESRTVHPLYLNLLATCDSHNIEKYLQNDSRIDEVWVTTMKIPTVRTALIVAKHQDYSILSDIFTDEELMMYRAIGHR